MAINDTNAETGTTASSLVNEWDEFLATSRPDIGHKQYVWWGEFLRSRKWDRFGIVARDGDAICGGANVLVRSFAPGKRFYYIPHGPVLPENDADAAELFDDIVAYVNERRKEESDVVSHLRLEPRWLHRPEFVQGFEEARSWHEPRNTLCVDLSLSEDAILQQMKKKGRYNIRVARRHEVSVVEDTTPQGLADFLRLYEETVRRQGIRRHSVDYFHKLAATLFPWDRGSIYFAEYQGERLATSLMIYCGDTATYKYGGSLSSHRNVMAPYLLHFEIMLRAKALGYRWYDFYGVKPQTATKEDWATISAFKRKFGGRELNFISGLDLVYDADAYQDFREWMSS